MKYKANVAHDSRLKTIELLNTYVTMSNAEGAEKAAKNEELADTFYDLTEAFLHSIAEHDGETDLPDIRTVLIENMMLTISLMGMLVDVSVQMQKQYPNNRVMPVLTLPLLLEGLGLGIELISLDEHLEKFSKKKD